MKAKNCVICNIRKGKRFCVKEEDYICSKCCGLIRDPQLCPNDCPYFGSLTEKKGQEELPIYKVLMTTPKGSRSIVVAREKENGNIQFISTLVDEWKMGLKDCFGSYDIQKKEFNRFVGMQPQYADANLDECKEKIKRGILIAETLGLKLPREFSKFKRILGDLDSIELTGSLYKCFDCGKADLTDAEVEAIKEVTLRDVAAGDCGSESETMLYFVCDDCKGKEECEGESNEERALAEAAKARRGRDKRSRYRRSRDRRLI